MKDNKTYKIVRYYLNDQHQDHRMVVEDSLTLEQARAHCKREDTHQKGVWFDGYTEE